MSNPSLKSTADGYVRAPYENDWQGRRSHTGQILEADGTMNFGRRKFLRISCGLIGAGLFCNRNTRAHAAEDASRPNILFIGCDDLRTALNCYEKAHIHSPNIDRLASEGVLFERAYVQQAVCAASRASFLTGCRPDTTGADYPYSMYFVEKFLPAHPSLPAYFHRQGYYTRTLGKIHHGYSEDFSEPDFDAKSAQNYALEENRKHGKYGPPFEMADVQDNAYRDGILADETIATMRRATESGSPFFLAIGFHKPHLPFCAPQKYWDLYDPAGIDLPANRQHPENSPPYSTWHYELSQYSGPNDRDGTPVPDDHARALRHGYYACVSYVDALIGQILDELDRLGLRDNTIVMFWSDHGFHLGEHAMWCKETNFELDTHAPLIVRAPGIPGGLRSPALVEYVDMFPTLTELTGIHPPHHLEGTSMVPLLTNPERPWKDAAFSQYPRGTRIEGYAMRTDRYRYVEWWNKDSGGARLDIAARELYDHDADPMETKNVAVLTENSELVRRLSEQLEAGWRFALPEGIRNESHNAPAPRSIPWSRKKARWLSEKKGEEE